MNEGPKLWRNPCDGDMFIHNRYLKFHINLIIHLTSSPFLSSFPPLSFANPLIQSAMSSPL